METVAITPIGTVHNDVQDATEQAWHKITSEIHVKPELAAGLRGLEDWSHVVILYVMHQQAPFDAAQHLVCRPRERDDLPEVGIFAQRARHRPNQIGLTAVKLLSVAGNVVTVRGLDALNGTPVLDIKPYAPIYDGVSDPRVPSWFIASNF